MEGGAPLGMSSQLQSHLANMGAGGGGQFVFGMLGDYNYNPYDIKTVGLLAYLERIWPTGIHGIDMQGGLLARIMSEIFGGLRGGDIHGNEDLIKELRAKADQHFPSQRMDFNGQGWVSRLSSAGDDVGHSR